MSLIKKLFGGGTGAKKDVTAREGHALAQEALRADYPMIAEYAYLCCVYTSSLDTDIVMSGDGTCRAWHFDFFSPSSRELYLVRIQNGKVKVRNVPWEKTDKSPVEYVAAVYGTRVGQMSVTEPLRVPDNWIDSPAMAEIIQSTLGPIQAAGPGTDIAPLAVCFPAECVRYIHEEEALQKLGFPPPPKDCCAVICVGEDLYEEDCYLLYMEAGTGKVVSRHTFRFPELFYFGNSRDW